MSVWYVYLLLCRDGTYYTGVTTDLIRRVAEHNGAGAKGRGAKYTQARRPVRLVYSEELCGRGDAQQREHALRTLSRGEKVRLANNAKL